ncbi:MAG: hypothetical protein ABI588_06030 [Arenimonas sp.]
MKPLHAVAFLACLAAGACSDKPKGLPMLGDISQDNPMSKADVLANLFEVSQRTCADPKWQKDYRSTKAQCLEFSAKARPACEKTATARMPASIHSKTELHEYGAEFLDCLLP